MKGVEANLSVNSQRFNFVRINVQNIYVEAVRFCNWFGKSPCFSEVNTMATCYRCVSSNGHVNTQNKRYSVYKHRLIHEMPLCDTKFREWISVSAI